MSEQSGFFDAHLVDGEYDRVYLAESFAKYFASFIGNGIFGGKSNELMVQQKETSDMSVRVLSGQGWINGYWYENTDELSLSIDIADGVLNRIDIIVLRWSNSERVIRLAVKKGTPSTSASAPILQRDADCYELKLAQIYIKAGATKIIQSDITDTRLNNSVCGLVQGVIKQFDTTEFGKQIDSFIESFEASNIAKMNAVIDRLNAIVDDSDIASLVLDVETLKSLFVESNEYPGCYYRLTSTGVKEWVNPPMIPGETYRTVERYDNKPVYVAAFYYDVITTDDQDSMMGQGFAPGFVIGNEGNIVNKILIEVVGSYKENGRIRNLGDTFDISFAYKRSFTFWFNNEHKDPKTDIRIIAKAIIE